MFNCFQTRCFDASISMRLQKEIKNFFVIFDRNCNRKLKSSSIEKDETNPKVLGTVTQERTEI
jgi:hypothetical protein